MCFSSVALLLLSIVQIHQMLVRIAVPGHCCSRGMSFSYIQGMSIRSVRKMFMYLYPGSTTCSLKSWANPGSVSWFCHLQNRWKFTDRWKIIMALYSGGHYGMHGSPVCSSRLILKKCRKGCKARLKSCNIHLPVRDFHNSILPSFIAQRSN